MEITVLTENTVSRRGLLAEHGLSVLVEEGGKRILFDTGQSGVYIHNAEQLGISLEGLDAIVLSHGHYDHTGGLPEFPGEVSCPVYLSGKALEDKWCLAGDGKGNRCIGVPWREDARELERLPLIFTWEQEEIFPVFICWDRFPPQCLRKWEKSPSVSCRTADICRIPWKMSSFL